MDKILYINSSVRPESRTNILARYAISKLDGEVQEINLEKEAIQPLTNQMLETRTEYLNRGDFSLPILDYAKQFASADIIVISAPYWDLSFPSSLKVYFEAVNAIGITFHYTADGKPESPCKAKRLIYITTAGGKIFEPNMGLEYVKGLSQICYNIPEITYIKAEMLDIIGADVDKILSDAKQEIDSII